MYEKVSAAMGDCWLNGRVQSLESDTLKEPLLTQIVPLIAEGVITMDHLIKRDAKGRVSEKGPLFKIFPQDLDRLFSEEAEYFLHSNNSIS